MWDESSATLHLQVGLGSGNEQGTFIGDHDGWRLPEADDHDTDPLHRYVAHRPVLDAAPAGQPISPNLAGRVSAAFALASQQEADPVKALALLGKAQGLYARAATAAPPKPLVTALPHAFYPESVWQDDMELGGAEIARAAHRLGLDAAPYLASSAHWASRYLELRSPDTLNLYDVGALAHASLADAMAEVPHGSTRGLAPPADQGRGPPAPGRRPPGTSRRVRCARRGDRVRRQQPQLRAGRQRGASTSGSPAAAASASFATRTRTWLLGGNPWGVSAMVGVGSSYPRCMQHQVANLADAPDLGAVVNGPNGAGNFEGGLGGFQDGMRHCSRPGYATFDGQGSRYVDDVRAWQTDEPALDMTAAAILAAAAQLSLRSTS